MRLTVKIGLLFALIWIALKMIIHVFDIFGDNLVPPTLLNILCILLAISVGLYKFKRRQTEHTSLLQDIKNGMAAGIPYTLIVSGFLYFYYSTINPEYIEHKKAEVLYKMKSDLDDPVKFKRLKSQNEDFEVMTKEQIYERMAQGPENTLSAKATMIFALLAMLMLTTLNSIFVAVVYRKVVFQY